MLQLVAYDIAHDGLRNRVAKKLLQLGMERVQYSVFIGKLTEGEKVGLVQGVTKLKEGHTAFSFLMLPLHKDMLSSLEEVSVFPLDWDYLKGEKKCLIL